MFYLTFLEIINICSTVKLLASHPFLKQKLIIFFSLRIIFFIYFFFFNTIYILNFYLSSKFNIFVLCLLQKEKSYLIQSI